MDAQPPMARDGAADEDLYEDGAAKPDDKNEDSTEAMLPTAFFGGRELKVGQRETVEITQMHGDQVSVKCIYGEDKEESDEAAPPGEKAGMPAAMGGGGESDYD